MTENHLFTTTKISGHCEPYGADNTGYRCIMRKYVAIYGASTEASPLAHAMSYLPEIGLSS